jgi:probable 2-oxoglutarate dehydrogenase E1 component DHKTD1
MLRLGRTRVLPRLGRGGNQVRGYDTRNCFGHRVKAAPKIPVKEEWLRRRDAQPNLWRLVCAYRDHGHRVADLDPLQLTPSSPLPELEPSSYGLGGSEAETILYPTEGLVHGYPHQQAPLSDIIHHLRNVYCGALSLESAHIMDTEEKEWLAQKYEETKSRPLSEVNQRSLLWQMVRSQTLDNFLGKKFGTLKRYGAEGAEAMMAFFQEAFSSAASGGVSDVIISTPHRGRLNLLTGMLHVSPTALFHKIRGNAEFYEGAPSVGDVLSHLSVSVTLEMGEEKAPLHVNLLPNPSHLEAVNPVVMGKTRARLLSLGLREYWSGGESNEEGGGKVLPVQVHGDASFSGQGVVMETLGMASLPHYGVGGTLHLVVNNQLGFTAPPDHGRSSHHCTDVVKMIGAPVFHVNGDHPEEVVRATAVAMDYWMKFQKDVVVDLVCFRRWGHNEMDNPSLTQPTMYSVIDQRPSVPDLYSMELESQGVAEEGEGKKIANSYSEQLNACLKEVDSHTPSNETLRDRWEGLEFASPNITIWDTGLPEDVLKYVGAKSVSLPEDFFKVSGRLERTHITDRLTSLETGVGINWATAEALAIGTLLYQGFNVRLSGQDVGRGTFSHRHSMLVCQESNSAHIPLNNISPEQTAFLEVANSSLSEEAVLGFEYGFSIESPRNLVLWEAQFGDFFNGAQIMIDTFVSSGEAKWLLQSGLVMLLPHGLDGMGPEHSSCRLERFLQLTDSREAGPDGDCVNMHVVHPTTPAQYFHLLRKQIVQNFRKPLIVASPKIILRLPEATSSLQEMGPGTSFSPVLGDETVDPKQVSRVVLCCGKHYYPLAAHRRQLGREDDIAIVRLEQLCPFPSGSIHSHLVRFPSATGEGERMTGVRRERERSTLSQNVTVTVFDGTC